MKFESSLELQRILQEDAANNYFLILNKLEEIHRKVSQFLQDQLKLQDIPFFEELLQNKTPAYFLDVWGKEEDFLKYLQSLLKLKQKMDNNFEKSKQRVFDLQGIFQHKGFFEFFTIKFWKDNAVDDVVYFVYPQEKIADQHSIVIENVYIQGASFDQ